MKFDEWQGWNLQGPAIGGGVVRRFERVPGENNGGVQWLEREGEELVVRASILVACPTGWANDCALAAVFDSFLQKID